MNDSTSIHLLERPPANPALKGIVADLLREGAEKFILPRFRNLQPQEINTKTSETDFVTIADQQTELWLTPRLIEAQSGPVIGEEAVSVSSLVRYQIPSGYSWTLDPLDGTKNFVRGKTAFCSMVALLWNGRPVESWIWQPLTKILFYAADQKGAFRISEGSQTPLSLKGRPIDIDFMRGSGNSLGLSEPKKSIFQACLQNLVGRQFTGSAGIQGCLIANGEEDFLIHGNSTPWDHAPVDLLCREAGGYAAGLKNGERFHASTATPFMAASSQEGWEALRHAVWCS
ncbi:inositol monophosphatase [Candidatus Puniceispirillum sp.]|nr:inositol monophosphatase [Candidatus Puniceispirillum sp.]